MKSFVIFIFSLLSFLFLAEPAVFAQTNVSVTATGGTTPNKTYAKLSLAFTAINNGVHTGVITVNITGNINEGTITSSLMYSGYNGTASYTSILIQPSGGARTISGVIDGNALIKLNGADNITINGINSDGNSLTIRNASTSTSSGTCTINFLNGATNNTITNCTVLGSFSGDVNREAGTTTKGGTIYFAADALTANGNDNNTISNCNIGPIGTASLPWLSTDSEAPLHLPLRTAGIQSQIIIYMISSGRIYPARAFIRLTDATAGQLLATGFTRLLLACLLHQLQHFTG